jgi:ankyrin repeat protein
MTSLAEYLLILDPDLLDMRNNLGETALFRAAHYGKAEMFELLADIFDKKNELEPKQKEAPDHLKRHDGTTIIFFT